MKNIWNILTLILLLGTLGVAAVVGVIYLSPGSIKPGSLLPVSTPKIIPSLTYTLTSTASATSYSLPPTWTVAPATPTLTSSPVATNTPQATNTIYVLPSYTSTPTPTNTSTLTVSPTFTSTSTSSSGSGATSAATKTPTKTKTKTPAKTATPCPAYTCGITAVDDEVTSDIFPTTVDANLTANDHLNGLHVRIVSLLKCDNNCEVDSKGRYTTKVGKAKVEIISDTSIRYYPAAGFMGMDSIDYKIQSDSGLASIATVTFTVTDGIQIPPDNITSAPSPLVITENGVIGTYVGSFTASDANGGPFWYFLVSGSGSTDNALFGLTRDGTLKTAAGVNCETDGSLSIRVMASDPYNFTYEKSFPITVNDVNEFAPTITSGSTASGVEGNAFSFNITSSDSDCDTTRTITMTGSLPAGLTFAANAGVGTATITGTPSAGSAGTYNITLRVTDYGSLFTEKSMTITITEPTPTPTPTNTPTPTETLTPSPTPT